MFLFSQSGFLFDHCVHLSFTQNSAVLSYLKNVPCFAHKTFALNYYHSQWLVHPVQDNLFPLSGNEKSQLIDGFRKRPMIEDPKNYYEWLLTSFGKPFTDSFPTVYTLKYWCTQAVSLFATWCGERIYRPSLDEVLYGASHLATPNVYYAKEMRYPKAGGYASFFARTDFPNRVVFNKNIIQIDPKNRCAHCQDGTSFRWKQGCFSSLPLPLVPSLILNCLKDVVSASKRLRFTSVANVSIGFNKKIAIPSLWFYIYDEDIPFARAYSPSLKSPANAPGGLSSIQLEHYYLGEDSLTDQELISRARLFLSTAKIANDEDIAVFTLSASALQMSYSIWEWKTTVKSLLIS
jgi:protoporphyrinogen oxidase